VVVLTYVIGFFLLGRAFAGNYMKENPLELFIHDKEKRKDHVKTVIHHVERQEEISFVLCGFAIISLVFIMTIFKENIAQVELVIGFFSLAFVFEIISAFFYHDVKENLYTYAGTVFQYGGLFSIMIGFFTYFLDIMDWSLIVILIYTAGVLAFILLSAREIGIYLNYSQGLEDD